MDEFNNSVEDISTYAPDSRLKDIFFQRSEAAQEIISRKPAFFERWALLLFLVILLLLIAGTWFIRYPDIIEARGKLSAENAPKEIFSLQAGRLVKLLVKDGEEVRKGEVLGWLESAADAGEVLALSHQLDSAGAQMQADNPDLPANLFNASYRKLGELQTPYQAFITAWQQYNDYVTNGFYAHKKKMLLEDMMSLRQVNASLAVQKDLTREDEDSSERTLEMNTLLFNEKVISAEEYRTAKRAYLNKKMAIPQLNASLLGNQSQQRDKLKEIEQLEHDVSLQKIIFGQALLTLKSAVDGWVRQYVLAAPIAGRLVFAYPLEQNKFIEQGKLLGYVNPDDSKYYVEITLSQNNLGKVDTGMAVQLRFDAYPYQEAGFVKGKLDYISPIASDTGFLATVRLPEGLTSSQHRIFQYKNGLSAKALVITKDMRLLQRIWYSIVKSVSPGR